MQIFSLYNISIDRRKKEKRKVYTPMHNKIYRLHNVSNKEYKQIACAYTITSQNSVLERTPVEILHHSPTCGQLALLPQPNPT